MLNGIIFKVYKLKTPALAGVKFLVFIHTHTHLLDAIGCMYQPNCYDTQNNRKTQVSMS